MRHALLLVACSMSLALGTRVGAQENTPRLLLATGDTTPPSVEATAGTIPPAYLKKISLHLGQVTRRDALRRIGSVSGLQFVYANDVIAAEDTVRLDVTDVSIMDALREVLRDARIDVVVSTGTMAALMRRRVPSPSTNYTVRGAVYDSVAGRPLAGAVVQVAAADSPHAPWTTTTDSGGAYVINGLSAGRYTVGFFHDALTALGLESATRGVELSVDSVVTADLALPSIGAVVALRCGERIDRADRGMLVGAIREAADNGVVTGAVLRVRWGAIALDSGHARVVTEQAVATIESDGTYLVCGLPLDAPLELQVSAPGHREIAGPVLTVPRNGIGQQDVLLADSVVERGPGVLRGYVKDLSGKAVTSGRVLLNALHRDIVVRDGAFVLSDLPRGSWILETRVIGTEPHITLVTVTDSERTETTITVDNTVQRLDAVTVIGKLDRNTRVLEDVLRRRRHYPGTFFLPGSDAVKRASFTSDLMKEARGFTYRGATNILARGRGDCVALFVDNAYEPQALDVLDQAAPLSDLLAVETYPSISLAPVQFRFAFGRPDPSGRLARKAACAVVVVWTKRDF